MPNKPMEELTPGKLARPMDRNAMSNDMGIMKNLLSLLNNPHVTGAEAPPDVAVVAAPAQPQAQTQATMKQDSPAKAFRLAAGCRSIFFTGAAKSGKSWLASSVGARIMEMEDPIVAMIREVFGEVPDASGLQNEIFAWGDGLVTQKYPLTASRMQFVTAVREMPNKEGLFGIDPQGFGIGGFWVKSLIARADLFHKDFPNELLIVTDVWEPDQFKALRAAGFAVFHVMCNNITRSGRGGTATVTPLVNSIERDITNKLSQEPRGRKLLAVWCDPSYPPTSGRLLTMAEFANGVGL